jgi:peptidoglycan/xylan/chitin deacetylase (PgdA/CDA1 family)
MEISNMLIRRQDLCVLLFYYLGYSRIRNLAFRLQGKPVSRFVTFHDLLAEAAASFRDTLRFLKEKTNVVSIEDYFSGRLSSRRINVVITFDDGYKSWARKAVTALKELELPATFFVSSGFLALPKDVEAQFIRSKLRRDRKTSGGLSEDDVRRMAKEGFTIGGHTCNHVNLAEIHDRAELWRESLLDKKRLEAIIGTEIQYFSYPFGKHRNRHIDLIELLKEAGYKGAVTVVPGFNTTASNSYLLSREIIALPIPLCVLNARVHGTYDGVNFLKNNLIKLFSFAEKTPLTLQNKL